MRGRYQIAEIFKSIQGEGRWAGRPVIFVRFAGCNLNCEWCDTDHSERFDMTAREVYKEVNRIYPSQRCPIVFTGGEPLLQMDKTFSNVMKGWRGELAVETNGTCEIRSHLYPRGIHLITVSPKTLSGVKYWEEFTWRCHMKLDLKIVFDSPKSFVKMAEGWGNLPWNFRFVQPCERNGKTNLQEVLDWLEGNPDWRLSVQLHKMIGIK